MPPKFPGAEGTRGASQSPSPGVERPFQTRSLGPCNCKQLAFTNNSAEKLKYLQKNPATLGPRPPRAPSRTAVSATLHVTQRPPALESAGLKRKEKPTSEEEEGVRGWPACGPCARAVTSGPGAPSSVGPAPEPTGLAHAARGAGLGVPPSGKSTVCTKGPFGSRVRGGRLALPRTRAPETPTRRRYEQLDASSASLSLLVTWRDSSFALLDRWVSGPAPPHKHPRETGSQTTRF